MSPTVREVILHCQKQMKKVDQSDDKMLHYIGRLSRLRIETDDLISTGIGRTINQISREPGVVGEKAHALVTKWKALVEAERSSESAESATGSSSSEGEEEEVTLKKVKKEKVVEERDEEDSSDASPSPPKIFINGVKHSDTEEEEKNSALPNNVSYSRNQDESDNESDSDSSDRLCIDENDKEKDRKRRGDSGERDEKELKKPKIEQKTPEKKPNPHDCLKPKLAPRLNVEIDSTSGLNFFDVLSALDTKRLKKSPKKPSPGKKSDSSPKPSSHNGTPERSVAASSSTATSKTVERDRDRTEPPNKRVAKVSPYVYTPPSTSSSKKDKVVKVPAVHAKVLQDLAVTEAQEDRYWEDSRLTLNGNSGQAGGGGEDALSTMMAGRNQRTKVYSGVKAANPSGKVPTLFKMCLRMVQENVDRLEYTGGVPFDILEPVLRRITLSQLMHVEHYNPYLIESTDDIWKYHCNQNFRGKVPDEMETWRELYYRCVDERTARFQSLTSKLKTKLEDATPVRKAKLAYVESNAGPKFNKSKAATIKSGMSSLKTREEKGAGRSHGTSASSGGGGNSNTNVVIEPAAVIIAGSKSRSGGGGGSSGPSSGGREGSMASKKPKKAPLMQKTLKSMKTLMRR